MPLIEIQVLISAIGVVVSGVTGYFGIKVALAEVRRDISASKENIRKLEERMNRLEEPYFNRRT